MTSTETSIRKTLAGLSLFDGALPHTLDYFAAHFVEMRYRSGACISLQGTEAFLFSVVLEGDVEVLRNWREAGVSLYKVREGEAACFAAADEGSVNDCTAVAVTDTLTLAISGEQFRKALQADPRVQKNIEEAIAAHDDRLRTPEPIPPEHAEWRVRYRNSQTQE